jgi:predicted nicotinamide N-methyase
VVTSHVFAGETIRVVRPAEPDRLLSDPAVLEWNRHDDYMPYWAYLWPGAFLLASALAREAWPDLPPGHSEHEALEIGCGLGLAGLVALARGLRVHFTDYDQAPLEFVARSLVENDFDRRGAVIRRLDWREPPEARFPIILAADVLYEVRLIPLIAALLDRMLTPGGTALIATPHRTAAVGFTAAVTALGLDCRAELAQARSDRGEDLEGVIYRVRRT